MHLARVADTVCRQSHLDAHQRIGLLILMQDIDRDDLPEDLQPLYDEMKTYLDAAKPVDGPDGA
jgi:hypothetical protein